MAKKRKDYAQRETEMMQEFFEKEQILQEWDLKIKKMRKLGKDYKLRTNRGTKLLKVGFQEDQIMFMYLALEHLARNGCFQGIPRLIPTKYGDFYVKSELGIFYLTDWFEGKEGKSKELKQVMGFAKFLAEIHLAAKELDNLPHWALRERWDDITCQMEEKAEKINENIGSLPQELRDAWCTYELHAYKAQNLLRISGYKTLMDQAKREKTFCHRQFTPEHGVIAKGISQMLSWEHCAYGVQVSDLVYLMQKILPEYDWDYHIGEQIIKAYHQVKPLLREEIMTLGAALAFPLEFVKLAEKYLMGKLKANKISDKLAKIKEQEEKKNAFLEEYFSHHDLKGFCWGESSLPLSNVWYMMSPKDLRRLPEKGRKEISALLPMTYMANAQGKLREGLIKDIHGITHNYKGVVFPVVYTPHDPEDRENVLEVLSDHYLRDRLLGEIEKVFQEDKFAGVNIKFQLLSAEEMESFNEFIKFLSPIAREKRKLILVSVSAAKGENLYYDYEFLGRYCDYLLVEIMEEDSSCPEDPVSKAYIQAAIIYAAAHVPREKIVAVLPAYQESTDSLLEKAFFARQFGIGGCAFWRMGLEDEKIWSREPVSGLNMKKWKKDEDDED